LARTFLKENLVLEPEGATGGRLAGPEAACGRRERDLRKARPECCLTRDMCLTLALLEAFGGEGLSFARPLGEAVTGSVGRPAEDDAVGKHRGALGDLPQAGPPPEGASGEGVEGEILGRRPLGRRGNTHGCHCWDATVMRSRRPVFIRAAPLRIPGTSLAARKGRRPVTSLVLFGDTGADTGKASAYFSFLQF